ncbi:hypothetical protein [Lacticaseibacillus absianus]|uniref:hypothetical protein n=1 Tax=Lacticaseibacillus absianus TaxID=2729623 RepID=UPI001FEC89DD|nr:hypothetical protein [Lacticaseibacillus absianus]
MNVKEIVEIIHLNLPNCRINLLSCIPCVESLQGYQAKGNSLRSNATLRMVFAEYQRMIPYTYVHLINMFDALLDRAGQVDPADFKDGLHVNDQGYAKLVTYVKTRL